MIAPVQPLVFSRWKLVMGCFGCVARKDIRCVFLLCRGGVRVIFFQVKRLWLLGECGAICSMPILLDRGASRVFPYAFLCVLINILWSFWGHFEKGDLFSLRG